MTEPAAVYAFPTKARCPKCRCAQTFAYGTSGRVQYRRCDCGSKFKMIGWEI